ncbi:MAG: winged helix-turn-helix domain-containing protein [Propionibacteriaceae bacterium]|jgi:hypothetical protein|nr:winged helix-turn-helix domain-containing protein [Propionibacteriaceae bacterium]
MRTEAPLLAPIFRSDGQARLLAASFLDGELSLSDLAGAAKVSYPSAHREVGRLLDAGILAQRTVGRARLIRPNEDSPLVPPLNQLLMVCAGPLPLLRRELSEIAGVDSAFVYGSFAARVSRIAGPAPRDIDLMVVGRPDPDAVYDACARVEDAVRRPVNPTILTSDELLANSGFMEDVRANPVLPVIGEPPWR